MPLVEGLLSQIRVIGGAQTVQPGERFRVQVVPPALLRPPLPLVDPAGTPQGLTLDVGTLAGTFDVNGTVDPTLQPLFNALQNNLSIDIGTLASGPGAIAGSLAAATDITFTISYSVEDANGNPVTADQYRLFPESSGSVALVMEFLFKPILIDELAESPIVQYTVLVDFTLTIGSDTVDTTDPQWLGLRRQLTLTVEPLRLPAILLLGSHKNFDAYGSPKLSTGNKKVAGMLLVLVRYGSTLSGDTPEATLNNLFSRLNSLMAVIGTLGDLVAADALIAGARTGMLDVVRRISGVPTVFAHCGNADDLSVFRKGTWIGALIKFIEAKLKVIEYLVRLAGYAVGFFFSLFRWLGRAVKAAVKLKKLPSMPGFHPPSMPNFPVLPLPDTFLYEASSLMLFGMPGTKVGLYGTVDFGSYLQTFTVADGQAFVLEVLFKKKLNDRCASVRFNPGERTASRRTGTALPGATRNPGRIGVPGRTRILQ